jgi:dihydrofolate reductase
MSKNGLDGLSAVGRAMQGPLITKLVSPLPGRANVVLSDGTSDWLKGCKVLICSESQQRTWERTRDIEFAESSGARVIDLETLLIKARREGLI